MSTAAEDIKRSFVEAHNAQVAYCEALTAFSTACLMGDDEAVELLRATLVTCVENFTHHHAEAHRRMRSGSVHRPG